MSSSLRSLFVVGFLFAGMTGCAAESGDSEPAAEEQAESQDQEEAPEAKVEANKLAIQKKLQISRKPEPKK
jgi:hypothetical protein